MRRVHPTLTIQIISAVLNRYKDDRSKYGGDLAESWHEALRLFQTVTDSLGITPDE